MSVIERANDNVVIEGDDVSINGIPFSTTAAMDLYVRDADGDDTNPGTSALPLKTLTKAESLIPYFVQHVVKIHVGPHSGSGYGRPTFRPRVATANIYVIGDGGGGGSDGFTELVASSAAQTGSDATVVVTTGGLSATEYGGFGEYFGKTIEILSGSAAGDRRTIRNNTATDIYPNVPFSAAVASGDTYRIVEPETDIYHLASEDLLLVDGVGVAENEPYVTERQQAQVFFVNLRYDSSDTVCDIMIANSSVVLLGFEISKRSHLYLPGTLLSSGVEQLPSIFDYELPSTVTDLGAANDKSWAGWGISIPNATTGQGYFNTYSWGTFIGSLNVESFGNVRGFSNLLWGCVWGSPGVSNYNLSTLSILPIDFELLLGSLTVTPTALSNAGDLFMNIQSGNKLTLASTGDSFKCTERGVAHLFLAASGGIDISHSSGVGMLTAQGGQIQFLNEVPAFTPSGDDFSENNGAVTRLISALTSGALFSDMTHGSIRRD